VDSVGDEKLRIVGVKCLFGFSLPFPVMAARKEGRRRRRRLSLITLSKSGRIASFLSSPRTTEGERRGGKARPARRRRFGYFSPSSSPPPLSLVVLSYSIRFRMTAAGDWSIDRWGTDGRPLAALFSRRSFSAFPTLNQPRGTRRQAAPVRPSVLLVSFRVGFVLIWDASSVVPVRISNWGSAMRTNWLCLPLSIS